MAISRPPLIPLAAIVVAILIPFMLSALGEDYLIGTATRIVIYALAAMSLNLLLGYGGMVSFGHAAYFGVGAYVVGIASFHVFDGSTILGFAGTDAALLAWPLAVVVSAAVALVLGALSLRTSGVYFIMITLAFAQMLYFLFVSMEQYGGDDGVIMYNGRNTLPGLDLSDDTAFYFVCLAFLIGFTALVAVLIRSRFGKVLQASRQNEARMQALGCKVRHYKLATFVLAGAAAGLAGALNGNHAEYVSPDYLHWTKSGDLMIMVILGGIGTLFGPIVGAAAFLLLEEFLPVLFDAVNLPMLQEHWRVVFGPLLILIVLYARGGLLGSLASIGGRNGR